MILFLINGKANERYILSKGWSQIAAFVVLFLNIGLRISNFLFLRFNPKRSHECSLNQLIRLIERIEIDFNNNLLKRFSYSFLTCYRSNSTSRYVILILKEIINLKK